MTTFVPVFVPPSTATVSVSPPAPGLDPYAEARVQRLEKLTNESVGRQQLDISELRSRAMDGLLVAVKVKLPRFTVKLEKEELGFSDELDPEIDEHIEQTGRKSLIPLGELRRLKTAQTAVRSALYDLSYKTAYGHWLPAEMFAKFKANFTEARTELHSILCGIADNIEAYHDDIPVAFAALCRKVWKYSRKPDQPELPPNDFKAEYYGKLQGALPNREEILIGFECFYTLNCLYTPDAEVAELFAKSAGGEAQQELAEQLLRDKSEKITTVLGDFNLAFGAEVEDFCDRQLGELAKIKSKGLDKRKLNGMLTALEKFEVSNFFKNQEIKRAISLLRNTIRMKSDLGQPLTVDEARLAITTFHNQITLAVTSISDQLRTSGAAAQESAL